MAIQSDTHYQLLQLVRVCKLYQAKCLAQNTALTALGHDTPSARAALTLARIQEIVATAQGVANEVVGKEFSELELALVDGTDFLPALKSYLGKH